MTDQPDLREIIASVIREELGLDHGHIPSQIKSEQLADAIIAVLPANALKLTVVKPLNLGHSIGTGTRRD